MFESEKTSQGGVRIPVFEECQSLTDNVFWKKAFGEIASGKMPQGLYLGADGCVCCNIKGKMFSYQYKEKKAEDITRDMIGLLSSHLQLTENTGFEKHLQVLRQQSDFAAAQSQSKLNTKKLLIGKPLLGSLRPFVRSLLPSKNEAYQNIVTSYLKFYVLTKRIGLKSFEFKDPQSETRITSIKGVALDEDGNLSFKFIVSPSSTKSISQRNPMLSLLAKQYKKALAQLSKNTRHKQTTQDENPASVSPGLADLFPSSEKVHD